MPPILKLSSLALLFTVAQMGHCFALPKTQTGSLALHHARQPLKMSDAAVPVPEVVAAAPSRGGDSSVATSTFNLAKSIIGCGVLSLPSGISFFSDAPGAILPASVICTVMGLMAAYTFSNIGRACEKHKVNNFQDAWSASVGPKYAWMISVSITSMCFTASLAYSILIGDSFTALSQTFNLPAILQARNNVILLLTSTVLYPLCSMSSLAALSPFSLVGLGGTMYTALFMAKRYLDGSYKALGKYSEKLAPALRPSFNVKSLGQGPWALNNRIWVLVSMLSTSYIAHYNAPKFYSELKDTDMKKFNKVVVASFSAAIAVFVLMMNLGYLTFGGVTSGFVLNNYANADALATFARMAIGVALITGYPFTFCAMRDGVMDLAKLTPEKKVSLKKPLTLGLVATVTSLALVLKDVGFVVSLSGALFGSTLMFIVPAYMHIKNLKAEVGVGNDKNKHKMEILFNRALLGAGGAMGALGVAISVLSQMGRI